MAPFGVADTFVESFRLVFRNFMTFLTTQGVFLVASGLLGLLLNLYLVGPLGLTERFLAIESPEAAVPLVLEMIAVLVPAMLVGLLVGLLAGIIGIVVADAVIRGERPTLGEAWSRASPRLWNFVGTGLLVYLAIIGVVGVTTGAAVGLALGTADTAPAALVLLLPLLVGMIVVVVWLLLRWSLVFAASVFETRRPVENLARSAALTRGSKGAIFLVFLLFVLVFGVGSSILTAPFGGTPSFDPEAEDVVAPTSAQVVASGVVTTAISLLSAPVYSVAIVIIYRSLLAPAAAPPPPDGSFIPMPPGPPTGPPPGP